jgi:hypothetical protein
MSDEQLRPIERTVRRLRREGYSDGEVAWRLRRSPRYVQRVSDLSLLRRSGPTEPGTGLRPIERCILAARSTGSSHPEIASRLRRSPGYVSRVEELANYKLRLAGSEE